MADVGVRPATAADAPAVAAVQQAAWTDTYRGALPAALLDGLAGDTAVAQWGLAVTAPPSGRHHLLVAVSGAAVVGFSAAGPSTDRPSDHDDAELLAMGVLPARRNEGHGSRLVNATADVLRGDGFTSLGVWLSGTDPLRAFLEGAGWAADGTVRRLDLHGDGVVVLDQLRLSTSIADRSGA